MRADAPVNADPMVPEHRAAAIKSRRLQLHLARQEPIARLVVADAGDSRQDSGATQLLRRCWWTNLFRTSMPISAPWRISRIAQWPDCRWAEWKPTASR